jgi:hypothetical protein
VGVIVATIVDVWMGGSQGGTLEMMSRMVDRPWESLWPQLVLFGWVGGREVGRRGGGEWGGTWEAGMMGKMVDKPWESLWPQLVLLGWPMCLADIRPLTKDSPRVLIFLKSKRYLFGEGFNAGVEIYMTSSLRIVGQAPDAPLLLGS